MTARTRLGMGLVVLLATAIMNTAANRRLTFGVSGPGHMKHQLAGLIAFGMALGITTGAVKALFLVNPAASRGLEVLTLVIANAVATAVRYGILRIAMLRERVLVGRKAVRAAA